MRLFDKNTLNKLDGLTLHADSIRLGVMKGDRRSRKRGSSIEFADYRNYVQGDDLRRLDWHVYARLDRPFVKLTEEEEDLAVHILVDTSDSMNWPIEDDAEARPDNKLRYAFRLCGALGYIGLLTGDLLRVTLVDSSGQNSWGPFRGRSNGWSLIQFLETGHSRIVDDQRAVARRTNLDLVLRDYALRARKPGLLLLLSDLFSLDDYRAGLDALRSKGYEIGLLHLLSPDEVNPDFKGDLNLIDVETGDSAEVTIDPFLMEDYLRRLDDWKSGIDDFCRSRAIRYLAVDTGIGWESVITHDFRRMGLIR